MLGCGPAAEVAGEETTMPKWVCGKCKTVVEGRCRPANCPKCKAPKEQFKKKA
jgi:rubrerythrin